MKMLFSEIYLEEITRQVENAEVLTLLNLLAEYRGYADTRSLHAWRDSYVHEVLSALGFFAKPYSESLTYLFPMGSTGNETPLSVCLILLPEEDLDSTQMGAIGRRRLSAPYAIATFSGGC